MTEVVLPLQTVVQKNFFLAGNWLKTIVFAAVAAAVVAGTFFLEGTFLNKNEISRTNFTAFDYKNDNFIPDNGIMRFADNSVMNVNSIKNKNYVFELKSGKVWSDFTYSSANTNFIVGKVVLIPDQAVFDASFDGSKLELNVYDGDVYVGFLPDNTKIAEYIDPYAPIFINRLLVSRENQLAVPMEKVTEEIRPLLYSKLVKEFKLASLADDLKSSAWAKNNIDKDKKAFATIRQQFDADALYNGTKVREGWMSNFAFWAEENLTYVPEKKQRMYLTHLFNYLDDAIYYADQNLKDKAEASMQAFNNYMLTLSPEVLQGREFTDKFENYIQRLKIFGPGDEEYKLLKALLNQKFLAGKDRYAIVRSFWQDVYKGMSNTDALAEEALNNYYEYFDKTRVKSVDYLAYQNQLFDNLLMKYPLFYKDGYFAIKTMFENDLLDLYADGQSKDELKQAFVNNKINFMKRLKRFFFDGALSVDQAKEIYKRLFGEISDLMPKDTSGLAVIKLFESQLADMNDFWGYLNAPDYQTSANGGDTNEARYKIYLRDRTSIASFFNVQEDVLGKTSTQNIVQTIDGLANQVKVALQANKDVNNVEIGKINAADQRFVPVKFVLGGYPVEANYDRENDAVKDVKVYKENISDHAVKLQGLLTVLQQKFADLSSKQPQNDTAKETIETTAQRFARNYIANTIAGLGFKVTAENVKIIDQLNAVYRVENVVFKEKNDMLVTFDVLMSGEMVTNVFLTLKGQPQTLSGKYSFKEFADLMAAEGEIGKGVKNLQTSSATTPEATDAASTRGVER
ncbi:hypothetical protein HZA40_03410 [Candidatus Peregrinibacteria bacterium]|nr:hypothetical protein [Candidatus Peregrinibacteria bacterium]